jgi:hypothetical protein
VKYLDLFCFYVGDGVGGSIVTHLILCSKSDLTSHKDELRLLNNGRDVPVSVCAQWTYHEATHICMFRLGL